MKPGKIILVRHAESVGNIDQSAFAETPDHAVELTPKGIEQAAAAGREVAALLGPGSVHVYVSPYRRTRQTLAELIKHLPAPPVKVFEEPRLREQDFGNFQLPEEMLRIKDERHEFGRFYYRFPNGESGADVYDRVSTFLETLHRDFQRDDYAQNALIVSHGLTIRLFLMRWFHWTVEKFDALDSIENCEVISMTRDEHGRYHLDREMRIWEGER